MNLQVMERPAGQLLWVSGALPGSVHDKEAAWTGGIEGELAAAGLPVLADKGYQGGRAQRPSGTRESPRQGPLPDGLADTASQVPHPGGAEVVAFRAITHRGDSHRCLGREAG
jgi:hypothetical protein